MDFLDDITPLLITYNEMWNIERSLARDARIETVHARLRKQLVWAKDFL